MPACTRSPGALGSLYGLAAAAGMLLGCSLALDFTECKADSDCMKQNGDQWVCSAGQCMPPAGSATDDSSTGQGPDPTTTEPDSTSSTSEPPDTSSTTVEVTATTTATSGESTDGSTSETTGTPACTVNSECEAELGDGHLCIDSACVNALTDECQVLTWPSMGGHDKVVLIGSIIPASDPYAPLTLPLQNALQLAIADYNKTTDLPGGNRIAWITCDDKGELDRALAAAEHLTGTLKIQAIVGPIFSEQVLAVAEQVTIDAGTFLITPTATAKDITTLDDDGLVWRTITSDVYQANAVADRVLDIDMPPVTRLALLHKEDAYGNGIASDVVERLMVPLGNGLTVHPYPDPTTLSMAELMIAYGTIVSQAWGAQGDPHPDTLVFAGTSEIASLVLLVLNLWNSTNPPVPLPRLIVTHGAVPSMEDIINHPSTPDPLKQPLMGVLEGTAPVVFDPQNFASFNARYKAVFNDTDAITASSLSYDAGMVVMFAMAAIPMGDPITGAAIRDNIAKLQDPMGTKVSFDDVDGLTLTFIKTAHNALVTDKTVDLKGVSGELEFDLQTGEVRTDILGWGLLPKMGDPDTPVLTPLRLYTLQPPPSEVGTWMDLP
jgi:ABC-type branched-subunit amino acid transport system substrate-binding protein